ncbi:hypothetical protein FRC04_000797 [Tulasnella sp. 424]|nr:hypothetical protein FRC04_000797 [Tulasnella sp. 424]KAG8965605.1 hypothetical protein FRC05_003199 [Tulasnella sp. 425]
MDALNTPQSYVALTAGLSVYLLIRKWLSRRGSDMPRVREAPNGHWFWGHELQAFESPDSRFFLENSENLGSAYKIKGAWHDLNEQNWWKSAILRPIVARIAGRSVVWAEGKEHTRQRQALLPFFTAEQVRSMEEDIKGCSDRMVAKLRDQIVSLPASSEPPVIDVLPWTSRATLDVIGVVGFGYDFQCGDSPAARIISQTWSAQSMLMTQFPAFVGMKLLQAFPILNKAPFEALKAQERMRDMIKDLARNVYWEQKGSRSGEEKEGRDLLSRLMRMKDTHGMDLEELLEQMCAFFIAGRETTGTALAFSLLELGRHPEVQSRLRQELLDFGREPTYADFQAVKLPYLDAVCKEVLRVYPAIVQVERVALCDDVLPLRFPITTVEGERLNSIRVKKDQIVSINAFAINRNKSIWGPDADVYRPERWLNPETLPPSSKLPSGIYGLSSFGLGTRLCLGYRLALLEWKIILCDFIKNFEFTETTEKIETRWSTVLQPYVVGKTGAGPQVPLHVKAL